MDGFGKDQRDKAVFARVRGRATSSAAEHFLHTEGVTGSIPVSPHQLTKSGGFTPATNPDEYGVCVPFMWPTSNHIRLNASDAPPVRDLPKA